MIHPAIPVTLLALAAPAAATLQDSRPLAGLELAQVSIHERIIIRVPRMSPPPAPVVGRQPMPTRIDPRAASKLDWREHKGPKCVAVADIAGAMVHSVGAVDLLMDNGTRLRAKLDGDCTPLDYYDGFYIRPAADGQICRDRDAIRMRSGARCEIDDFKALRLKD